MHVGQSSRTPADTWRSSSTQFPPSVCPPSTSSAFNYICFQNIGANNLTNIASYTQQTSDRYIKERASALLATVHAGATGSPFDRMDAVEGEFLNIVGAKFYKHVRDDAIRLSQLSGAVGWMPNSLGAVSTQAKFDTVFDQPFSVSRTGYLIDVPGVRFAGVDRDTGVDSTDLFRLISYMSSAYESYVWQENARTDAVSTVRGIQYASEHSDPIIDMDSTSSSCDTLRSSLNVALSVSEFASTSDAETFCPSNAFYGSLFSRAQCLSAMADFFSKGKYSEPDFNSLSLLWFITPAGQPRSKSQNRHCHIKIRLAWKSGMDTFSYWNIRKRRVTYLK